MFKDADSHPEPVRGAIPFNRACFQGKELVYIARTIDNGHIMGDGAFSKKCEAYFEERLGVRKALLTTSCTDALEMAAILLDIKPGDEVILPSFNFVSGANAFVLRGATPVFADIREDTLNLDEGRLESLVSERTKAILLVHYAGVACALDETMQFASTRGIPVVEDNAHGLFGSYKGRPLGSFGALATQSFHETKNITCGEGGALLINDGGYLERAEIIREKGTNRSRFFRGQVDKYTWVDIGSSYLPSDMIAAFLYAQLEHAERIQSARKGIWERYHAGLQDWAAAAGVRLPVVPPECGQAYHMFYMLMPDLARRQALIAHLRSRGIGAVFHYLPLHLSDMGVRFGGKPGDCPVTENISDRLVRLPFFNELTAGEQDRVIVAVKEFSFR